MTTVGVKGLNVYNPPPNYAPSSSENRRYNNVAVGIQRRGGEDGKAVREKRPIELAAVDTLADVC